MSLVMAIANQNGVVVSGDWRAMKYWLQPDGGDPIFVRSIDRFQKIYRTKSNHCIGFCGHTKLDNGKELGEILQKIIEVFDKDYSVTQEFYILLKTLPQNAIKNDIAFMVAGYENDEPKIITYSIDKEPIQNHILNGCAFAGIGVPEYISKVSNVSHEEIEKMSLKDMIRFEKGYQVLATGEMGIGNTTTSSAVAAVLLGKPVEDMTGRGAGLTSEGLVRKINAIKKAIALNNPDRSDAIDVLAKVGGLDIAGMAGVFIGGAALGMPVVMDGFISCVSALIAIKICPQVSDHILASHVSKEPAAQLILKELGKEAIIHAGMCLGEGTGAVALFPMMDLSCAVYNSMSTFGDINVEQYEELK